jgi:hypothetical protein
MSEEAITPIIDSTVECMTEAERAEAVNAVANGDVIAAKDIPTPEEQDENNKKLREAAIEAFKQQWLKQHNIENVDLEKELELIQAKKSYLSRSRRDAVVQFFAIFPIIKKYASKATYQQEVSDDKND